MMKDVVKVQMELEVEGNEIEVSFGVAIQKHIDEDLTKKEREEIERLSVEISKIVSKAVKRKMDEEMERDDRIDSLFDKTKDELYEQLSEEDKKEVDEFEKELNKCNTLEEALILTLNKLKEK